MKEDIESVLKNLKDDVEQVIYRLDDVDIDYTDSKYFIICKSNITSYNVGILYELKDYNLDLEKHKIAVDTIINLLCKIGHDINFKQRTLAISTTINFDKKEIFKFLNINHVKQKSAEERAKNIIRKTIKQKHNNIETWCIDDKWIFQRETLSEKFICNYTSWWNVFENDFQFNFNEIQIFTKIILEEEFKECVYKPVPMFFPLFKCIDKRFVRTFHPIGQGGFYSEKHLFKNSEFNVVYDCGSQTLGNKKIKNKIVSTFSENQIIDILFISHFHKDHISGIEYLIKHCNVKNVVIPLLDEEAKALCIVSNFFDFNYTDTRLINNPDDFFGNINVIKIEPYEFIEQNFNSNSNARGKIGSSSIYPSATQFTPFDLIPDWFYIPINFKQKERSISFKEELNKKGISLNDLRELNNIIKYKSEIKDSYYKVKGSINENSLVLFSGKKTNLTLKCNRNNTNFDESKVDLQCGCLYTGDVNLNSENLIENIALTLSEFIPFIGTMQIPHHGSLKNYKNNSLSSLKNIVYGIISHGKNNSYKHPSDSVVNDLISNNVQPISITEEQDSLLIQFNP